MQDSISRKELNVFLDIVMGKLTVTKMALRGLQKDLRGDRDREAEIQGLIDHVSETVNTCDMLTTSEPAEKDERYLKGLKLIS